MIRNFIAIDFEMINRQMSSVRDVELLFSLHSKKFFLAYGDMSQYFRNFAPSYEI